MATSECRISKSKLENGMLAIELDTPQLKVVLLPEKGADIYSIQYKNRGNLELLWRSPWGAIKPGSHMLYCSDSKHQWLDCYHGGWQIMFPNAGNECLYKGALYGFHGEASMVPWTYRIEEEGPSISIRFSVHLPRTPYQIERVIQMNGAAASICIEETITNRGAEEMQVEWGQHIAFGEPLIGEGCELHIPAESIIGAFRDQTYSRLPLGKSPWPHVHSRGVTHDMSRIPPRNQRSTDFGVLCDLKDGWYALSNHNLDLTVGVVWDSEIMPYVWLWQEFQGLTSYPFYGRCYVMGVEPCSTYTEEGLLDSVEKGVAIRLQPQESKHLGMKLVMMEGVQRVKKIDGSGTVEFFIS